MAAPIATSTTIALAALWCTCFQQYVEGHRKEGPLCPLDQVGDDANANKSVVRAYVRSCGRGVARNVYLGEHIPESKIFFGLWLVPLGYLAYKSEMFPKALGVMLIAGGACYLVGLLAVFL